MAIRRKPAWKQWKEAHESAPLTTVRRKILENIQDGRDPYAGFSGSQLGGAIRSVQQMRTLFRYIEKVESGDPDNPFLKLTTEGAKALNEGKN